MLVLGTLILHFCSLCPFYLNFFIQLSSGQYTGLRAEARYPGYTPPHHHGYTVSVALSRRRYQQWANNPKISVSDRISLQKILVLGHKSTTNDFGIRFVSCSFNGKKGIMNALPIAVSSLPSINLNTYSEAKKKRGYSDDSQRIATHINA